MGRVRAVIGALAATAALVGVGLVGASSASAVEVRARIAAKPTIPGIPDCKDAPTPERPGSGLAGMLDSKPDPIPTAADPFADHPTTSIYDQYGYAGLTWHTYDLGCGGAVRDPEAATDTMIGNLMLSSAVWLTAATNGLHNKVADPASYMGPLDRVVDSVTQRLRDAIWGPWGGLAVLAVPAMLLLEALRGSFPGVVKGAVWAVLILGVVAVITQYPTRASSFFDDTITSTIGTLQSRSAGVDNGSPGQGAGRSQGALTVDRVLYDAWLRGQLGSSDSAAAKRWGPALFRASAMTWAEDAAASSPEATSELTDRKAEEWKQVADEIAQQDPATYSILQGKTAGRTGNGAFALLGAVFVDLFRLVADVFLLAGLVVLRLLVMFLPAAAVVGVFAPMSGVVKQMANIGGAAVINVIAFSAGSVVYTAAITGVLGTAHDRGSGVMALVLCLVITLAAFVITAPLLSFKRVFGHAGGRGHGRRLRRQVTSYFVTRQGVNDGTKHAIEETPDEEPEPTRPAAGPRGARQAAQPRSEAFARPDVVWDVTSDGGLSPRTVVPAERLEAPPAEMRPLGAGSPPTERASVQAHPVDDVATVRSRDHAPQIVEGEVVSPPPVPRLRSVPTGFAHDSNEQLHGEGIGHFVYDPRTGTTTRSIAPADRQAEAS